MSLLSIIFGIPLWIFNSLFSSIRPFLNPFLGPWPVAPSNPDNNADIGLVRRGPLRRPFRDTNSRSRTQKFDQGPPNPLPNDTSFKPAIIDVIRTRQLLRLASAGKLPVELEDIIIDFAEYWPHVSAAKSHNVVARGSTAHENVLVVRTPPVCSLATAGADQDSLGLPEPTLLHPVRKIIFRIRSHDQGWSGEDPATRHTYMPSYTWFDAELDKQVQPLPQGEPLSRVPWELSSLRFLEAWPQHSHTRDEVETSSSPSTQAEATNHTIMDRPSTTSETDVSTDRPEQPQTTDSDPRLFSHEYLETHQYEVQYNLQSHGEVTEHTVEWRYDDNTPAEGPKADELRRRGRGKATGDGRFVRCMRAGDCVSLWAKARFLAWANTVESAKVEVYFVV
jgi:hypothetical protein